MRAPVLVLASLALLVVSVYAVPPKLRLRSDGTFTVLQLADLHYGEGENVAWGPQQDVNSTLAMKRILSAEPGVDLVVFSGDQITGNNIDSNGTAYWAEAVGVVAGLGIPFFTIFGNHDDMPLQPDTARASGSRSLSITTRRQLVAFETEMWPDLSYTQAGPEQLQGVSNFIVPVYPAVEELEEKEEVKGGEEEEEEESPALVLYALDSGGGTLDETLTPAQVSWLTLSAGGLAFPPALLFVHIPPPEVATVFVPPSQPGSPCVGALADDGITPTVGPNGLVSALASQFNGSAVAVMFGHDHGNAYCCATPATANASSVQLCYGRHSGYGGYGDWARGARVLRFSSSPSISSPPLSPPSFVTSSPSLGNISVVSWIRMEDGTVNSMETLYGPH